MLTFKSLESQANLCSVLLSVLAEMANSKAMSSIGVAKSMERFNVPLNLIFYNVGLQTHQVSTQALYNKWVLGKLRRDVRIMIHNGADVICFSELGTINGHMERGLAAMMTGHAARAGFTVATGEHGYFVQIMLRELVDDSDDWKAFAMAHYGLLINIRSVKLIQEPVLVSLHQPHPIRKAMKFKIAPAIGGVEKPTEIDRAEVVEVWNLHCPSSANHPN